MKTDQQIIDALIARDEQVTRQFFFRNCRPLFTSIIRQIFSYNADYDELVNELYVHLMENNAQRLRQFQGRSTIYQWLKVIAIRYFIAKRNSMTENSAQETPYDSVMQNATTEQEKNISAKLDIEQMFSLMTNKRYVYVLQRLVLQEAEPKVVAQELNTNVDNLYNIKKRAMASLAEIALKETKIYEKEICK